MIASIAFSIVGAVYLGVAESAANAAIASFSGTPKAADPSFQRFVGLMHNRLRVASWSLDGIEVCDLAMDVAGGAAFFKGSPIERAYRDIRGIKFHPLTVEQTLVHAGKLALGQPCDEL